MERRHTIGFLAIHVRPLLQQRAYHWSIAGFHRINEVRARGRRLDKEKGKDCDYTKLEIRNRRLQIGNWKPRSPNSRLQFRISSFVSAFSHAHSSTRPVLMPNLSISQSNLFASVSMRFASGVSFAT